MPIQGSFERIKADVDMQVDYWAVIQEDLAVLQRREHDGRFYNGYIDRY